MSSSSLCLLASTDHAPAGCPAPRFTRGPREPRRQGTGSRGHSPSHTLAHKGGFKRKNLKLQGLPTHRCRSRTHLPATQNLATLGHPFPARFLAPRHLPAHLPKPLRQPFNCSPALVLPRAATLAGEKPKGKQRDKAQARPGTRCEDSSLPGPRLSSAQLHPPPQVAPSLLQSGDLQGAQLQVDTATPSHPSGVRQPVSFACLLLAVGSHTTLGSWMRLLPGLVWSKQLNRPPGAAAASPRVGSRRGLCPCLL